MNVLKFVAAVVAVLLAGCGGASAPAVPETKDSTKASVPGAVVRVDPALDTLIAPDAQVEKLAGGYQFLEGPLWRASGLWFSDLVGNVAYQWAPDGKITEVLKPGGYDGKDAPAGAYLGSNGMAAAPDGAVLIAQHGNRRIVRMAADGKVTTLVDRYQGKRLNSPNDLVYAPDGALYFTDPPYGLPKQDEDAAKELKFNGVFRLAKGKLQPVIQDIARPNGIAFSPDYKTLYVSNSEPNKRVWMRYSVATDGSVSNGRVFADITSAPGDGVPDGFRIDSAGNLWASGPGGIWIFSSEGKHLGTVKLPETPSNCAWGDDGKTLYITAVTGLYRVRTKVAGMAPVYR